MATLKRRKRATNTFSTTPSEQSNVAVAGLETANAVVQRRLRGKPGDGLDFSIPGDLAGPDAEMFYVERGATNETKLNNYWNEPLTVNGATDTRKHHVAEAEKTLLARNAELGVVDGELSREDQARINRLRTYPIEAHREGRVGMPGVYSITANGPDDSPPVDFSGAYVITQRPSPKGELTPTSEVGIALLVLPGQPIEKFDSIQALTDGVESRLNTASERDALLKFFESSPNRRCVISSGGVTVTFKPIPGNVFDNRLESQIKRQISDLAYLTIGIAGGATPESELQLRGQQIVDSVRSNSDMAPYLAERQDRVQDDQNLAALKSTLPSWLKAPSGGSDNLSSFATARRKADWESERTRYLRLAQKAVDRQIDASKAISDVVSLDEYTEVYAKAYLIENGHSSIDPRRIRVDVQRVTKTFDPVAYQVAAGTDTQVTKETMSLPEYLRRNNDPPFSGSYSSVSVKALSTDGQPMNLNVRAMATALNIGNNYTKYLKDSFIAPSSAARREKMQQADRAVFEKDISQAKLQGTIGETQDKRGRKWAEAILKHPDSASRPKVDGYTIEASKLSIAGTHVRNVYVIRPKEKDSMKSLLLYMPDAPEGKSLREFSDGAELSLALKSDALRDHLLQLVDPGAKEAVRIALSSRQGMSIKETPVGGDFFDAMYEDRANHMIVNVDRATTSNGEVKKQSAWNVYNWGMEFLTPIPVVGNGVDLGTAGVGFVNSAEAARNGDSNAAMKYLFDAVTRVLTTDASAVTRRRSSSSQTATPALNPILLPNGKTGYQFSATNSETPNWKIPASFGVVRPSDIGDAERGVYSATRNSQKHEYVQIDGLFYESGQNSTGRYIQRPGSPTNRMQIVRSDDKWQLTEPPARALLGGAQSNSGGRLTSISDRIQTQGIANVSEFRCIQPELNSYLAADAARATFTRLVDLATAEGRLSVEARVAIRTESTPYQQAAAFTEHFLSRNGSGVWRFPDLLSEAENNRPRAQRAAAGIDDVITRERVEIIALANLPTMAAETFAQRRHDISKVLAQGGNQETFVRLVDLATAEGKLSLADRAQIMRQQTAYERASTFVNSFQSRNGDGVSNFPDLLKQAQNNGPRASAAPATIHNMIAQERSRLEGLPARLTENGAFDSVGLTRHHRELIDLLTAESNKGVQDRFLDTLVANESLGAADRVILGRIQNPYERGARLLDTVRSRLGDRGLASLPDALCQAIARTPGATTTGGPLDSRARKERVRLAGLPQRLQAEGVADMNAFRRLQPELASYLAEDNNQATFNRLVDLSVAEGRLTLAHRTEIMGQSTPYERAHTFTASFLSRNGSGVTKLTDLLSQAESNGPRASAAPSVVSNLIGQEQAALAGLPARLTAEGAFDSAGLVRHRIELIEVLTAESNREVHDRLLDILVADGGLNAADRYQIRRIRNPYERGTTLLAYLQSGGNSRLARFPAALERASEYAQWSYALNSPRLEES
ncbi:dermonecrotic toxin domain-containing protein [Burkholderia territorii]|uniref:dermonecrotic toxin domain-containing protein n=1 Tax=Burkholderia territorii TaxID=1503055 RepID=UPI0012D9DE04|nr:DUF6543 domain-containing protein [Burkholderia territorii]